MSYIESNAEYFKLFMEDDESIEHYITKMRSCNEWGGNQELYAASQCFDTNIVIHQLNSPDYILEAKSVKSNSTTTIHLSYHGDCHYNSVIMIDHIRGDDADADVNGTVEKSERELNDVNSKECEIGTGTIMEESANYAKTTDDDLNYEVNAQDIQAMDEVLTVNSKECEIGTGTIMEESANYTKTTHDDLNDEVNVQDIQDEVLTVNSKDVACNNVKRSQTNPFQVYYKDAVHPGNTTYLAVTNEHPVNEEVFVFSLIEALMTRDQSIITVEVLVSEYLLFQAQYRQELIKDAGWLEFFFEFSVVIKKKTSNVLKAVHILNKLRWLNQEPPQVMQVIYNGHIQDSTSVKRYVKDSTHHFQHNAWRTDEQSLLMLRNIIDDKENTVKLAKESIGQVI